MARFFLENRRSREFFAAMALFVLAACTPVETLPSLSKTAYSVDEASRNISLAFDKQPGVELKLQLSEEKDSSKFRLVQDGDAATLSFVDPPDFEAPTDANRDNVYEVEIVILGARTKKNETITVTINNVKELPPGVQSLKIVTNAASSQIAEVIDTDGNKIFYEGQRDVEGGPLRLSAVQVDLKNINGELPFDATIAFDASGKPSQITMTTGEIVQLFYNPAGNLVAIGGTTAKGEFQGQIALDEIDLKAAAAMQISPERKAATGPIARNLAPRGPFVGAAAFPEAAFPESVKGKSANISTAEIGTSPLDIRLRSCGQPYEGSASVFAVLSRSGALSPTYTATKIGGGLYRALFPTAARPGPNITQQCKAALNTVDDACRALRAGGTSIGQFVLLGTGACLQISGAIAQAGFPQAAAAFQVACSAAVVAAATACRIEKFNVAGIGDGACSEAGELVDVVSDDNVSYYAVAQAPGAPAKTSETRTASRFGPYPDVSVELQDFSTSKLEAAVAVPSDPAPGQSYTVTAIFSCLIGPGTNIVMSIVGTDGYSDSETCTLSGPGSCTLRVPGAAAGVNDTVTIAINGALARTLFLTF